MRSDSGTAELMRLNKTTAVGALTACVIVGATTPVWADSGSGSTDTAQKSAEVTALKAEVAKLAAELKADQAALHAATSTASSESDALASARAAAAHWRSLAKDAESAAAAANANRSATFTRDKVVRPFDPSATGYPCHHHDGIDPARNFTGGYDTNWHH